MSRPTNDASACRFPRSTSRSASLLLAVCLSAGLAPAGAIAHAQTAGVATAASGEPAAAAPAVAFPAPTAGAGVTWRPADGVIDVDGRGWGHGIGMSQYGAAGAATQGVTFDRILAHYYRGTTLSTMTDRAIRVLISTDSDRVLDVRAAAGLRLYLDTPGEGLSGTAYALPAEVTAWRVTSDATTTSVFQQVDGVWQPAVIDGVSFPTTSNVRFVADDAVPVVVDNGNTHGYRGGVWTYRGVNGQITVNTLPLENYLASVVPSEMPRSFPLEALKSQAVAARTYAAARGTSSPVYDICDTVMCQVYHGAWVDRPAGRLAYEYPSTNAAVYETRGQILTLNGRPITAMFSASNGGYSVLNSNVTYLQAHPDPYDGVTGSSIHRWSAQLPVERIEAAYPALGTFHRLQVTGRDGNGEWGGRVNTVLLEGVKDGQYVAVATTGQALFKTTEWPAIGTGLRSRWWNLRPVAAPDATEPTDPQPTDPQPTTPEPAPEPVYRPALQFGSRGPAVAELQRILRVGADGIYGNQTRHSVALVQNHWRVPVTGVVDARTWSILLGRPVTTGAPTSTTPPPPAPTVNKPTLRRGSRGSAVVELQRLLRITADGAFGPMTERAVRNKQSALRLPITGVVDATMWSRLLGAPAAPANPAPTAAPVLQRGSRGTAVVALQRYLRISADGIFGPMTERAVRNRQSALRIPVTGKVDATTRAAFGL